MLRKSFYDVKTEIICNECGNVKYDIHYPVILQPSTVPTGTVNNFSLHQAREFEKYVCGVLAPAAQRSEEEMRASMRYQIMYNSRFLISYKYEMCAFDANCKQQFFTKGAVWNTSCGSAVRLTEFFRGNVRYKEIILYILSSKIKEKIAQGEKFHPDWNTRMYGTFKPENYYICTEGFIFLFPQGTLKADCGRTEEYLVSFMELRNQMKTGLL